MQTSENPQNSYDWEAAQHFQKIFTRQAVGSYIFLSFGMGAIALLLPILLVLAGGYGGHYSISYFYHVSELCRNILVGCLWATGAFLILFHGLSDLENWILRVAGIAGISMAMNPMAPDQCPVAKAVTPGLHAASAIVFFLCIAFVSVALAKKRLRFIVWTPKRRRFKLAYDVAGAAMVAMPTAVAAIHFLSRRGCESHWIFWVECCGIWAFSFFWFVKTYEYRLLLRIH